MKEIDIYPFAIGNKLVRIRGSGFLNALDRVLSKHPNKYIKTKFAKNMDLITAKQQAAKESKAQKKPFYVFVDKDGEADISSAPLAGTLHKFVDGVEDKDFKPAQPVAPKAEKKTVPNQSDKAKELINKKENIMENKTRPAKKAAKKAAKKSTAPKKSTPAKPVGKLVDMVIKSILTKVKAGFKAFNADGKPLPEKYLAKMKDQSREIKVTLMAK